MKNAFSPSNEYLGKYTETCKQNFKQGPTFHAITSKKDLRVLQAEVFEN